MPFPSSSFLLSLSFPLSFLPALVLFKPFPLPPPLLFLLATLGKYSKRIPGFFSWLLSGRVGRRLVCVYCLFLLYHRRREGENVFFFFWFWEDTIFFGKLEGKFLFRRISFLWKQFVYKFIVHLETSLVGLYPLKRFCSWYNGSRKTRSKNYFHLRS